MHSLLCQCVKCLDIWEQMVDGGRIEPNSNISLLNGAHIHTSCGGLLKMYVWEI